eukprot:12761614-Alexandrium_andersonii.AAC.1
MADFTVYVGDASLGHGATRTTMAVKHKLDEFPVELRQLCLVVVGWAKTVGVCWNHEGSIGKNLKGVRWVMLAIV